MRVFEIDGSRDFEFLERVFAKLLINFTWWVNREDAEGSNLFEGGFMGLDNIGPIDRSHLPVAGRLEQSDSTGWMAGYAAVMATIAAILHRSGHRPAVDLVQTFLEHFAAIRDALDGIGLWDDVDGVFYDRLCTPEGTVPIKVRSIASMIPMLAGGVVNGERLDGTLSVTKRFGRFLRRHGLDEPARLAEAGLLRGSGDNRRLFVSVVGVDRVEKMLGALLDPAEFLSPHGLRSLSARHRAHPAVLQFGGLYASVDYEPAESTTAMFGGNSNWRGPVWFPVNYLAVAALDRYYHFFGEDLRIEYPTGSGRLATLDRIADDLRARLVALFLAGPDGRRPVFGRVEKMQTDPRWRDQILFYEYFNGDDGAGLGASHQTGWTGLVADLIRRRHRAVPSTSEVIQRLAAGERP